MQKRLGETNEEKPLQGGQRRSKDECEDGPLEHQGSRTGAAARLLGSEQAGHLRRVGVSGAGWSRFEKSKKSGEGT